MDMSTKWSLSCHQLPDVYDYVDWLQKTQWFPLKLLVNFFLGFEMFAYLAWWISSRLCFYCFWVPYLSPPPPDSCFFRHSCAAMQVCLKKNKSSTDTTTHSCSWSLTDVLFNHYCQMSCSTTETNGCHPLWLRHHHEQGHYSVF